MPYKPKTHRQDFDRSAYFSTMIEKKEIQEAREIRNTNRWRALRKMKFGRDPICEDPLGHHAHMGEAKRTEDVHHIQPIHIKPDEAHVMDNLMSVCKRCHARIEATCLSMTQEGATPQAIREALKIKGRMERQREGWGMEGAEYLDEDE